MFDKMKMPRFIGRMKTNCYSNSLQSDEVFDSESKGCNFSSQSPPGCEEKYFRLFHKMTSKRLQKYYNLFFSNFEPYQKIKKCPLNVNVHIYVIYYV